MGSRMICLGGVGRQIGSNYMYTVLSGEIRFE